MHHLPVFLSVQKEVLCSRTSDERDRATQSATSGGAIKGSAFWLMMAPEQAAPAADGGGGGLYGIYASDSTFSHIISNAQACSLACIGQ